MKGVWWRGLAVTVTHEQKTGTSEGRTGQVVTQLVVTTPSAGRDVTVSDSRVVRLRSLHWLAARPPLRMSQLPDTPAW